VENRYLHLWLYWVNREWKYIYTGGLLNEIINTLHDYSVRESDQYPNTLHDYSVPESDRYPNTLHDFSILERWSLPTSLPPIHCMITQSTQQFEIHYINILLLHYIHYINDTPTTIQSLTNVISWLAFTLTNLTHRNQLGHANYSLTLVCGLGPTNSYAKQNKQL
jgi:hypothetical protein